MTLPRLRVRELMFLVVYAALIGQAFVYGVATPSHPPRTVIPGPDFDESAMARLPPGTTRNAVRGMFGYPQRVEVAPDGSEKWTYAYSNDAQSPWSTPSDVDRRAMNQRITLAPSLTTLDRQEATVYMGPPVYKRVALRFRNGKLIRGNE